MSVTLDRRRFLTLTAGFGLAAASRSVASAQENELADPRLTVETVTFQVRRQTFKGLLMRPRTGGRRLGVLVAHEQRGADAFHRGFARRLALDGFVVLLPDLLSAQGISADQTDETQAALARMGSGEAMQVLEAAADLLAHHPECNGSIGVVGFSWGGAFALQFAIAGQKVKAAVAYYPLLPALDRMAEIKVPVLFHWSENDPHTAPQVEALEKRLIGAGRTFEAYVYPDTQSGFASDLDPRRWDAKASDRAYERSVFFLRRHLT